MADTSNDDRGSDDPAAGDWRPGVLVLEHRGWSLIDLDAGEPVVLDLGEVCVAQHPLLEGSGGEPADAIGLATAPVGSAPEPSQLLEVVEPWTFRLEPGRVLAWSDHRRHYLELDEVHLSVLDVLRRPRTLDDVNIELGHTATAAVCELMSLGCLREGAQLVEVGPEGHGAPPIAADEAPRVVGASEDEPRSPVPALTCPDDPDLLRSSLGQREGVQRSRVVRWICSRLGRQQERLVDPAAGRRSATIDPVPRSESGPEFVDAASGGPTPNFGRSPERDDGPDAARAERADPRMPVIPLYCWAEIHSDLPGNFVEPCLSVGMLFANARHVDGGRLNLTYDFWRIAPDAYEVFERWAADPRPAIFVFSDYLWNVDLHLDLSRRVKEISPQSLCIHGGPSCPKYEDDVERFFEENPSVDIAARGEGEDTFAAVLRTLDGAVSAEAVDRLAGVKGITFRRRAGTGDEIVRTEDRPRPTDLSAFPSPYLTGEFDDLLSAPWRSASIETNRGCPYGCTFCDWGSATMSRIRAFDLDRVKAELDWIMDRVAPHTLLINDANFGILERDVEITRHIANLKRSHPGLQIVIFAGLAKNTTKYTTEIFRLMVDAGLATMAASLAIQSTDPEVLRISRRQNIRLDRYDQLADTFADHELPVMTDILVGLPGSTVDSFARDLQHCFDRDVTARMFQIHLLPNSPMNEPEYRAEHGIVVNDFGIVVGSTSFSTADYERMKRLRVMFRGADHFGVLRHLLRFVQWDLGIDALEVLLAMDEEISTSGGTYPLLAFFGRTFDLYTVPPVGWRPFYDEFIKFLEARFGVREDSALRSTTELQIALMPAYGRQFPAQVRLEHDYPSYADDRRQAHRNGQPHRRLETYGPVEFTVEDPANVCGSRIGRNDFPVLREMESGNLYWVGLDWELKSPVARRLFSNLAIFEPEAA